MYVTATGFPQCCRAISDQSLLGLKQGQEALSYSVAVLGHPGEVSSAASTKPGAALQQSTDVVLNVYLAAPELPQPVNFRFVDPWFVLSVSATPACLRAGLVSLPLQAHEATPCFPARHCPSAGAGRSRGAEFSHFPHNPRNKFSFPKSSPSGALKS